MREADYVPKAVPLKGNTTAPPKRNSMGQRRSAGLLPSAKARKDLAVHIRVSAMASIPAVQAAEDVQTNGK
ncbi:hypothetical protein MTO96_038734 [Rhipicephalus appendiculatus]